MDRLTEWAKMKGLDGNYPDLGPDVCGADGTTPSKSRFNDSSGRADHAVHIEWCDIPTKVVSEPGATDKTMAEEKTVDRIMDSDISFHATYCKEELERFKLRSSKDVRYIPVLKRRLISVGQLDEECYHVGFGDQQWKVTKGSLVVARGANVEACIWLRLSSEITQSLGRSSDTSEGFENSGSFEDNGRLDQEYSEYKASSKEKGSETPQLRRSTRESMAPVRYSPSTNYATDRDYGETRESIQKLGSKEIRTLQWKKDINEEMVSLEKNQAWSLVRLPAGKKALQSKWVFRVKEEQVGKKRLVLTIVATENLHLEQLDVKTVFLHGDLDEDVYMAQPKGFQSARKEENLVCKLKKSLYGLKQASRQRYLKFDSFMQRAGYKRHAMDHCCYLKKVGSSSIILLLYADDMLVAGSDLAEIKKLKRHLSQEFEMKDLGPAKQILGKRIIRDRTKGTLRLSQEKYIGKVLEKFNIKDAKARCQPLGDHFKLSKKQAPKTEASRRIMAKVPYASVVGSVMYDMVCTRPDIAHAAGVVSRFMSNPGIEYWEAVKWLLRYLKDYGGCLDSGKSTTGYVFTVGGIAVRWMSRIQKCVAMSTTEAEYMAITEADKELVWLKNFLKELDRAQTECRLFCDNQSAINLAKNLMFHGGMKHIKIRYHYIRELVSEGTLSLKKILGEKNPADMLTKVVTTEKLKLCAASIGLRDN
ncbi:retrovirus-related pol polyprotein from transposon TNT 1-94 [Tanacetum coccineum]|uniref:Retrovirus-related pol polyprotein from transposon TNT 1-94 n=1 Tax=Tanacetum coccineum TaxID=301880 RepID=A0ABQ4XGX3_9ASTR